jgi:hypothetical protein
VYANAGFYDDHYGHVAYANSDDMKGAKMALSDGRMAARYLRRATLGRATLGRATLGRATLGRATPGRI